MPPVTERDLRKVINSAGKEGPRFYVRGPVDVFVGATIIGIQNEMKGLGINSFLDRGRVIAKSHGIVFETSDRIKSDLQTTVAVVTEKIGDGLSIRGRIKPL